MAHHAVELPRKHTWYQQPIRFIKAAFIDALILIAAYYIVLTIRLTPTVGEFWQTALFAAFAIPVNIVLMQIFGVYKRIWTRTSGHETNVIVKAVIVALPILVITNYLLPMQPVPTTVILVGNLLALGGFIAVRYRSRLARSITWRWRAIWLREVPESLTATRTLIIGAGESGQALAMRLKHRVPGGDLYRLVGFIDDDGSKHGMILEGLPILGGREDIPRLAEAFKIELIVFAIHKIDGPTFRNIIEYCNRTKARIKLVPDVLDVVSMTNKVGVGLLRDVQPEDFIGRSIVTRNEDVDLSSITGKVILITGAAGSVGSEITRQLLNYQPERLILLDNNESALHDLHIELTAKAPGLTIIPCLADITVRHHLDAIFEREKPQVIFHAAAYKHVPMLESYPGEALRVNVGGTRSVVEMALEHEVERFVLISTDKAVNPSSVMGASKRLCELVIHAYGRLPERSRTLFTAVRFGNVLGSRGSVVPTFNRQIDMGGPVTITHPEMTRYFMSISEAANLVIHAACLTKGDDIFVLKMGEVVRIQDLAERMIRLRGLRPFIDIKINYMGVRPGEKLHEELWDAAETPRPTVHPHIVQVNGWDERFDASQFLHELDRMLHQRFEDNTDALQQLTRLMRTGSREWMAIPSESVGSTATHARHP